MRAIALAWSLCIALCVSLAHAQSGAVDAPQEASSEVAAGAQAPQAQPAIAPQSPPVELPEPVVSEEHDDFFGIVMHGFASPGFLFSTGNNYLAPQTRRGSAEFAEVGVNFTKQLTDQLRTGVQLFARDLGRIGNYSAKMDWFYLDYRFRDWLGVRAGRVKIPFGLYNETNDIDAGRVPAILPQSIYPIQQRDFLLAQTGGEVYGYRTLGPAGALEYRAYGGTILLDVNQPTGLYNINHLDTRYVVGGRMLWEPPVEGLRMGASVQALRLDAELSFDANTVAALKMKGALPASFNGVVHARVPAFLWLGSLEWTKGGLLLSAEYSRWLVKARSSTPVLFPNSETTSERMYGMASYVVTSWFTPGVYYSLLFPDIRKRTGTANSQHDAALTLRFDLNRYWLIKLEGHAMHGTAAVTSDLNGGKALSALQRNWFFLAVKTTVYF